VCEKPAVRVLEAGLLGNGAMGVIVRTRPDAILLHFGHNAVWDRRVAEVPPLVIGTFEEFWQQWQAREQGDKIARQWTEDYAKKTKAVYDEPYPDFPSSRPERPINTSGAIFFGLRLCWFGLFGPGGRGGEEV
jgi:hypothetical protein